MAENGEIKNRIIESANDQFVRYGVRSVSMSDIAGNLGMSKKTLYQVFTDKDELVLAVTTSHLERQSAEMDQISKNSRDAIEALLGVSLCLRRNFREMNPSLLFDLHKYHRDAWDIWIKYKSEVISRSIADQIREGIREGYYRAEIVPEILAVFRMEQVQLAFDERVFPRDRFNFVDIQMQLFDHFVFGLLTEKGRELYLEYKKELTPEKTTIR